MTLRRRTNAGPWQNVLQVAYDYYGSSEAHGSLNDLKTAVRYEWSDSDWAELDTSYYRYWKDGDAKGEAHLLKFALGPQAFARLAAASNPFTASDGTVAQYADYYYEYGADRFATKESTQGGSRTFTLSYTVNPNYVPGQPLDQNFWMRKSVETLPDGTTKTVYCNAVGFTMLRVVESGSDRWCTFNYYDSDGRIILTAESSAISGYDEDSNDLLGWNPVTGLFQFLRDDEGLIRENEYYSTTGGGAAAGYLKARYLRHGQLGARVPLAGWEYAVHIAANGVPVFPVSREVIYRNDDGTGEIETTHAYTWHQVSGFETNQILQRTTTLPVVPTAQNGSGVADTTADVFDILGYRTWSRDARGFITKFEYDPKTGATTRRIDDVDTAQASGVPTGWTTPAGGGLNLVTDYEHDDQGRITQTLGPAHTIDLGGVATAIRTADWTTYNDPERITMNGRGYQKVSDSSFTLVNPVAITLTDRNDNVLEQIAAVRVTTAGKLLPTDMFPRSSYVAWTTHQYSDCCKLISTRVYHTIPASGEGASGTNYDQTDFGYDVRDRRNRIVSPGGTITFTVFDPRSLPIGIYVGTDDTGATEDDPTGGGAAGNNMVIVTANEYDDGQDGGDGNLTQVTQYASASDTRVTAYLYDWRNRRTDTDGELDFYETLTYDNLDRVTKVERFDTTANGDLVALNETFFDDRGRVYRTKQYEVDPSSGTIGSSLTDDLWYDATGNVLKREPDGVMTRIEFTYDSLGRVQTEADPRSAVTTFAYEAASNRVSLTDAEDNTTTWGYDPVGRVIRETNELSDSRTFEYSPAGRLSKRTDRNGRVIEFTYDAAGRVVDEKWLDGSTVANTIATDYNADSRITSISDSFASYAYAYDGLGRLIEIDNDGTPGVPRVVLTAGRDLLNERTSLTATVAGVADFANAYVYDKLGRMSGVTQTGQSGGATVAPKQVDFVYAVTGGFGAINRYADAAGTQPVASTGYAYDDYGRLTGTTHAQGSTNLSAYGRTFDSNRRVGTASTPDGTTSYGYDTAGQLTSADHSFQPDEAYSYDLTGNRTNAGYVTGTNNQLLNDGTHSYEYDGEGNRTKRTVTATGETTEYAWDHRDRLVGITFKNSVGVTTKAVEYRYDPQDRRIVRLLDADGNGAFETTDAFIFDQGAKGGLDDAVLVFDGAGSLKYRYLQGPAVDQPLAEEGATGNVLWMLADPLGTIHDLAERNPATGVTSVVNHLTYDSFGRITSQSAPNRPSRYGFTSRDWDTVAELYWYRARWYGPAVGRFTSEDPIGFEGDDVNLVRYVGNSPTNRTDPDGLQPPPGSGGFCDSIKSSLTSMNDTYTALILKYGYGRPDLANEFMERAYNKGPLGQTKDSSGVYYYGTRGSLGVATVATTAAAAVGAAEVAGAAQFEAVIGPGQPFHVIYRVGGPNSNWLHASGNQLGRMRITRFGAESADDFLRSAGGQNWLNTFRGPVLFPRAAGATGQRAASCITGAGRAYMRGITGF